MLIPLIVLLIAVPLGSAYALDINAQGNRTNSITISMDDVARMIRQDSQWQILDARPRQSGSIVRYRFKLISNQGKVKIITIDPKKPNLRRLKQ